MAHIVDFNDKFALDIDALAAQEVLKQKLTNEFQHVRFHLETAEIAHNREHARYLPRAAMYLPGVKASDTVRFMNLFSEGLIDRSMDTLIEHALTHKNWIRTSAKAMKINATKFRKLLHFTVLTCDLTLTDNSACFDKGSKMYVVQCSPEKEKQFDDLPGETSYLFHRTYRQSIYSIFRNGIQAMSGTQFEDKGQTHGPGIYLGSLGICAYGPVTLCYAIKNQDKFRTVDSRPIYLATSADICLRAILWTPQESLVMGDAGILLCVLSHYEKGNPAFESPEKRIDYIKSLLSLI